MADVVSVKIRVLGDDLFVRRVQAMRFRSMDFGPVLRDIAHDFNRIVEEQFATEGRRSLRPWAPLARETYLKRGSKHPILVEHGDLVIEATGPDNTHVTHDRVELIFPTHIRTIAESHQHGFFNVAAGHDVPARPLFDFTDLDRRRWRNKITNYLVNGDR